MAKKVIVIGGGAAGFFAAITAAETNPTLDITILEGSNKVLAKVLISGGGRCNVTHNCPDPKKLTGYYPRGHEFLLDPFKKFNTVDTIAWFEKKGVALKTEADGRMFPTSNSSKTIADCLQHTAKKLGIKVLLNTRVKSIQKSNEFWAVETASESVLTDYLVIGTGGNVLMWNELKKLDIELIPPVPSLFTFNATHKLIDGLSGLSFENAKISISKTEFHDVGPILITHRGISGPAVLKLSAWAARELHNMNYNFQVRINWLGLHAEDVVKVFRSVQEEKPKAYVISQPTFDVPKRMWRRICELCEIDDHRNWAETGKKQINRLIEMLLNFELDISGKSTFKEEFVTAGGVELSQIRPSTFEFIDHPNLYAAGEVLNIDAVTGGFNFQAAWTGGYLAGKDIGG